MDRKTKRSRRKAFNRYCDSCGEVYHRVNKTVGWTERNPGHRDGWRQQEVKLCMECQPVSVTIRIMHVARIKKVPTLRRRKRA